MMGTLGGFPNPPAHWLRWAKPTYAYATGGRPSTAALRASMMDSGVAWHPSLADESRSGSLRPLGFTPAARRTRRASSGFEFAWIQTVSWPPAMRPLADLLSNPNGRVKRGSVGNFKFN